MERRELWHVSASETGIRSYLVPQPGQGDLVIRSHYSLISPGTERLVASGQIPEELHEEMRPPFMKGDFDFPVSYGYSLVGKVMNGKGNYANQYVHCLHPHHSYACIPASEAFVIPPGIPLKRATLASNMETVVNAVWDSGISMGDKVLVAGFGIIGGLLATVLKSLPGISLRVMEPDKERCKKAEAMSIDCSTGGEALSGEFDMAFNCSASEAGLQSCIDHTGVEGKIIELSWYGMGRVSLNLGGSFHSRRKQIIASQVSQIPDAKKGRWDFRRRKELVFELLRNPELDRLITREITMEQAPATFDGLRDASIHDIGIIIKY